jgi:hypothetical protein
MVSNDKLKKPRASKATGDLFDIYIIRKLPKEPTSAQLKEEILRIWGSDDEGSIVNTSDIE